MEWQWRVSQKLRPPAHRWSTVLFQVFLEDTTPTNQVIIKTSSLMAKFTILEPVKDTENITTEAGGIKMTTLWREAQRWYMWQNHIPGSYETQTAVQE